MLFGLCIHSALILVRDIHIVVPEILCIWYLSLLSVSDLNAIVASRSFCGSPHSQSSAYSQIDIPGYDLCVSGFGKDIAPSINAFGGLSGGYKIR
jgi:hypothetical protein